MGEVANVVGFRQMETKTLEQLLITVGDVSDTDAIFNLYVDGVAQFAGAARPKIIAGQTTVIKSGLNIEIPQFARVTAYLESGDAVSPIEFGFKYSESGGGAELPAGDLNAEENRLEKIQGKTVEPFTVIPPTGSNFPGDSLDDENYWFLLSGSGFVIENNAIYGTSQFRIRKNPPVFVFGDGDEISFRMENPNVTDAEFRIIDTNGNPILGLGSQAAGIYVFLWMSFENAHLGAFNPATDKFFKLKREGGDVRVFKSASGESWDDIGFVDLHPSYAGVFDAGVKFEYLGNSGSIFGNLETTIGDYDQTTETNVYVFNPLTQKHEPKKIEDFAEILKPYLDALP